MARKTRTTIERSAASGRFVATTRRHGEPKPVGGAVRPDPLQVKARYVIQRLGGPTATARLVGVAKSQPSRWVEGREAPSPRSRKHLLDLDYVLSRLEDLYEASTAARWLDSPNSFLDGARPMDVLLHEGPGPVIEAVDATIAGSYA
jgi:uncharacterized protein (DUF2384 family)